MAADNERIGAPVASLWLLAAEPDETDLQRIIDDLAQRHGAPPFRPHLTILGDIPHAPEDLGAAVDRIVGACAPFSAPIADVLDGATFFRSFYALFRADTSLDALRASAEQQIMPAAAPFMPHVSLLYGPAPAQEKAISIREIGLQLKGRSIRFDRLALTNSGDHVPIAAWRTTHIAPLAGNEPPQRQG